MIGTASSGPIGWPGRLVLLPRRSPSARFSRSTSKVFLPRAVSHRYTPRDSSRPVRSGAGDVDTGSTDFTRVLLGLRDLYFVLPSASTAQLGRTFLPPPRATQALVAWRPTSGPSLPMISGGRTRKIAQLQAWAAWLDPAHFVSYVWKAPSTPLRSLQLASRVFSAGFRVVSTLPASAVSTMASSIP